jgi:hypothetical protein
MVELLGDPGCIFIRDGVKYETLARADEPTIMVSRINHHLKCPGCDEILPEEFQREKFVITSPLLLDAVESIYAKINFKTSGDEDE